MNKKTKSRFWTLLFPPKCVVCGAVVSRRAKNQATCAVCYEHLIGELSSGCPICQKPYRECICHPVLISADRFAYGLPYDRTNGAARKLILCCKSHHQRSVTDMLSDLMIEAGYEQHFFDGQPLLTYIPRSPEKVMRTGVDPAKRLAEAISEKIGIECDTMIVRKPGGKEQKKLNESERRTNVSRLYCPTEQMKSVNGRCVILVDDIITTGATLNTCIGLLRQAGAAQVYCLTAGKTLARRSDADARLNHVK